MGMSGSGGGNALGMSDGLRNALGIAGDAMAGAGGQQGVFGPAMAQQHQQGAQMGGQPPMLNLDIQQPQQQFNPHQATLLQMLLAQRNKGQ